MKLEIKVINSIRLTKLLIAASRWLSKYSDVLNDLNVYPVPDGDTGTNMSMTLQAVENDLIKLNHEPKMAELADIVSEAILLGARGNSGTILSQVIQGFLDVVRDHNEITVDIAARAFLGAKEKAYQAVSNPVEGTMLTVVRRVAEEAMAYQGPKDDFILFLVHLKNVAHEAVEETPNQLQKLKEAGVVDAGGKGIFYILEGFEKSVTDPEMLKDLERIVQSQAHRKEKLDNLLHTYDEHIEFKYCTEFIVESGNFDISEYKRTLSEYGDSIVCAQTSKKTKTHLHTNNPGKVLELAMAFGGLNNIKIDNMEYQHSNLLTTNKELSDAKKQEEAKKEVVVTKYLFKAENEKPVAYLAIADNLEVGKMFLENGAAAVLVGGQTANPSVGDIEEVIEKIAAKNIVILPNNKNIIGTANLVAGRAKKDIIVIETASMLEGNFVLCNKHSEITEILSEKNRNISIEVTKAVRDTKVDELEIKENNYIALVNGKIRHTNEKLSTLVEELKNEYITKDALSVVLVTGAEAVEESTKILRSIKNSTKLTEVDGKQENYPYYIYVENKNPNIGEIAIVTDSTADLTPELLNGLHVDIIPLKVKLNGDEYYRDGIDISKEEFWYKLVNENISPKTSQPSPAEFKKMYETLIAKGYKKILSIHLSSKLSGTQQAARVAVGMIPRGNEIITIFDSKSATFGLGYQVIEAAKMAKAEKDIKEIISKLEDIQSKTKIYFIVNDISYLEKGGRIGRAAAAIGGLLNLKPILKLEDGEISSAAKVIGEKGAVKALIKYAKDEAKKNSVIVNTAWAGTENEHDNEKMIRSSLKDDKKISVHDSYVVGPTIGCHTGRIMGVGIFPKVL